MPITKPTDFPRWCGIINGTTGDFDDNILPNGPIGNNSVIEPSSSKKDVGWVYEEHPPRNWFNWLLQKLAHWTYWFDQQETAHEASIAALETTSALNRRLPFRNVSGMSMLVATENIAVLPGSCNSHDLSVAIQRDSDITFGKRIINATNTGWEAFTSGINGGAVPAGVTTFAAGVTLYIHALSNDDGDVFDIGADSSSSAANLIAATSYTKYRIIGIVRTIDNGGTIELIGGFFSASTGYFKFDNTIVEAVDDSLSETTTTSIALSIPSSGVNTLHADVTYSAYNMDPFSVEVYGSGDTSSASVFARSVSGDESLNIRGRYNPGSTPTLNLDQTTAGMAGLVSVYSHGFWFDREGN